MSASTEKKNRTASREAGNDRKALAQQEEAAKKAKEKTKWIVSIFSTSEAEAEKKIKEYQRELQRLQWQYEDLAEAMQNAFDVETLVNSQRLMAQSIDMQIQQYKNMIAAEEASKNADRDQIEEWKHSMKELEKQRKEAYENMLKEAGGFGSAAEYKSVAQASADAWVDAFNQGEDALQALNDKWDEYIENLIKKQAMQRVAGKILDPLLKMVDDAIGDDGIIDANKLAEIGEKAPQFFEMLNSDLTALMGTLGYKGKGGSTELSALQQGIQGITEKTAEALESLLNSIRFFVASQTADVSAIRKAVESGLSINISEDSAIMNQLRLQTQYLHSLDNNLSSVIQGAGASAGIKVYMK